MDGKELTNGCHTPWCAPHMLCNNIAVLWLCSQQRKQHKWDLWVPPHWFPPANEGGVRVWLREIDRREGRIVLPPWSPCLDRNMEILSFVYLSALFLSSFDVWFVLIWAVWVDLHAWLIKVKMFLRHLGEACGSALSALGQPQTMWCDGMGCDAGVFSAWTPSVRLTPREWSLHVEMYYTGHGYQYIYLYLWIFLTFNRYWFLYCLSKKGSWCTNVQPMRINNNTKHVQKYKYNLNECV